MKLTSCLSEIADPMLMQLASYLTEQVGQPVHFYDEVWSEREAVLDRREAELGWICGLLHVMKERDDWPYRPVAAPIMTAVRYQQQPVYYSDVVVHQDSRYQSLGDLAGARWAYNESTSFSGYHMMRHWLSAQPQGDTFFAEEICSRAHSQSLQLVADGVADCACIDSTVLDMLKARNPTWQMPLRVVGTLGPYPMPPLVVFTGLDERLQTAVRDALCHAHEDASTAHLLNAWGIARWTAVSEQTYDPIRELPLQL